ncbi:MAG: hypothetical protein ABIK83_07880 [Candidatus Zixiibacteriota bacterium]
MNDILFIVLFFVVLPAIAVYFIRRYRQGVRRSLRELASMRGFEVDFKDSRLPPDLNFLSELWKMEEYAVHGRILGSFGSISMRLLDFGRGTVCALLTHRTQVSRITIVLTNERFNLQMFAQKRFLSMPRIKDMEAVGTSANFVERFEIYSNDSVDDLRRFLSPELQDWLLSRAESTPVILDAESNVVAFRTKRLETRKEMEDFLHSVEKISSVFDTSF